MRLRIGRIRNGIASVDVESRLPNGASAADLNGIVELRLDARSRTIGLPLDIRIAGQPPTFTGVTLAPSTVTIHSVTWAGPLSDAGAAHTRVEASAAQASRRCSRVGVSCQPASLSAQRTDGTSRRRCRRSW